MTKTETKKEIPGALIADGATIITIMAESDFEPLSLSEIAKKANMNPPTAQRVLENLIAAGWLKKNDDKTYEITDFFFWLGQRRMEVQRKKLKAEIERAQYLLNLQNTTSITYEVKS